MAVHYSETIALTGAIEDIVMDMSDKLKIAVVNKASDMEAFSKLVATEIVAFERDMAKRLLMSMIPLTVYINDVLVNSNLRVQSPEMDKSRLIVTKAKLSGDAARRLEKLYLETIATTSAIKESFQIAEYSVTCTGEQAYKIMDMLQTLTREFYEICKTQGDGWYAQEVEAKQK